MCPTRIRDFKMRRSFFKAIGLCISLFFAVSCGNNLSKVSTDAEGFEKIQKEMIAKFGEGAYYDNIYIGNSLPANSPGGGVWVKANVTQNPESLKMEEWVYNSYNNWQHTSEITVEMENGEDIKAYLFQLDDNKFSLKKVGELVTASAKKLADEKNLKNAVLESAFINTHNRPVSDEDTKIYIDMKPENGGTTFKFRYDLAGNLEDFSY